MYKYTDKQILDWLGNNYFFHDNSGVSSSIWMFYAPKGRQGDIRWVIEGAMERQGVEQNED